MIPSPYLNNRNNRTAYWLAFIVLLGLAFVECFRVSHDLYWPFDGDLYRDMSSVQTILDGRFGQDPSYLHEYIWYNPLLSWIETGIVKVSGLPVQIVIARAGIYLNILGPVFFFGMCRRFFDPRVALASLLSFLFLCSGNLDGEMAATYSPWLFPSGFSQFFLYLNLLLVHRAFTKQQYGGFFLLGAFIGLSLLSHAAAAVLIILLVTVLQSGNIARAWKQNDYAQIQKYILQGLATLVSFILVALPILYYVVGKYHLHMINRELSESREGIFAWNRSWDLLKENISVSLLVAGIGFLWFCKNFRSSLVKRMFLCLVFIDIGMYLYTMALPMIHKKLHLNLPDTVSSFHYFYFLKALQSVFFGFGLLYGLGLLANRLQPFLQKRFRVRTNFDRLLIAAVLISALFYFPFYTKRYDLATLRGLGEQAQADTGRIETYRYLVNQLPPESVILCEDETAIFPVMASGRKLVVASIIFSNPYVDFVKRYSDRDSLLLYLKTGRPGSALPLFNQYQVRYILLPNAELDQYKTALPLFGSVLFHNSAYSLFAISKSGAIQ
jgi:Dolichyl-phosphate-mannose-protein mannosyltransferase